MVPPEIIAASILFGLVNPAVIVAGLVLGVLLHHWWQPVLAAGVMAAVFAAWDIYTLPPGAEIVWTGVPASLVPPLAWCIAGFLGGGWWRQRATAGQRRGLQLAMAVLGCIVLGAVVGGFCGVAAGMFYVSAAHVGSLEGQTGYVVAFLFAPAGILVGAVGGGFVGRLGGRRFSVPRLPEA